LLLRPGVVHFAQGAVAGAGRKLRRLYYFCGMVMKADKQLSPARIRIMVAIFFFVSGFGFSTWASRIPTIQQQLHLNMAQLGAVLFALPIGLMVTLPVTSALLSRKDSRRIMMFGAIAFNVMLCGLGFATHTWQLVILLVCFGSSRNLLNIPVNAQSIGVQALYDRSIIARFHAVWSLAGFGGAAVGSFAVSLGLSPGWHFMFVGVVLTGLCLYAYPGTLPQQPKPRERRPWFALPDKTLVKYGLIAFSSMACEGTMFDWSGIYFRKAVHTDGKVATLGFVAYMTAMTLGRLTGDRFANRFGIRTMLTYSGLLIGSGLAMATLLPWPLTAGLGFILTGFGVSCVVPMVFSMAGRSVGMTSGSAIASVSTVAYLGFLMVPPLVGSVAQMAGIRGAFAMMAGFGVLITILVRLTLGNEKPLGGTEESLLEADQLEL
jgi:MFS family permease